MRRAIGPGAVLLGAVLALSGCIDPYGPGQRALAGARLQRVAALRPAVRE